MGCGDVAVLPAEFSSHQEFEALQAPKPRQQRKKTLKPSALALNPNTPKPRGLDPETRTP